MLLALGCFSTFLRFPTELGREILEIRRPTMFFGSCSVNFGIEEGFKIKLKFHIDFERDLGSLGARLGTPLAPIWEPCGVLGGALALKLDARRDQKLDKNRILAPRSLQDAFGTSF